MRCCFLRAQKPVFVCKDKFCSFGGDNVLCKFDSSRNWLIDPGDYLPKPVIERQRWWSTVPLFFVCDGCCYYCSYYCCCSSSSLFTVVVDDDGSAVVELTIVCIVCKMHCSWFKERRAVELLKSQRHTLTMIDCNHQSNTKCSICGIDIRDHSGVRYSIDWHGNIRGCCGKTQKRQLYRENEVSEDNSVCFYNYYWWLVVFDERIVISYVWLEKKIMMMMMGKACTWGEARRDDDEWMSHLLMVVALHDIDR